MEIHVIYNAEILFKTSNPAILNCDEIVTHTKGVQKKKVSRWIHEGLIELYLDTGQPDIFIEDREEKELTMNPMEALAYMREVSEELRSAGDK